MTSFRDDVPGYRMIRVAAPDAPVAALADADAWHAREEYPNLVVAGPVFGVAKELEHGGWEILGLFSALAPQDARDSMAPIFRKLAQAAKQAGDPTAFAEGMRAAERIDWEPVNELTVFGTRYRVVRADRFIRSGPHSPERPRPTDRDPGEVGEGHKAADPATGFIIDPVTATGMAEGMLKLELLAAVYPAAVVPPDVRADSEQAGQTHPGGVLLPAAFMTGELDDEQWRSAHPTSYATPQDARDSLAFYLRVMAPWQLGLDTEHRAVYAAAADRLDDERANEVVAAGRCFRVVRVERLMRIGPDGPEGPRSSDWDPQPPVHVQTARDRAEGLDADGNAEEDEDAPGEPDESTQRFAQLIREEQDRIKARRQTRERKREQPGR